MRPRIFWEPGVDLLIPGRQNPIVSAKLWWYQNTDESPNFSFLKVGLEKLGKKLRSWGRGRHPQPVGLISGSYSLQRLPGVNLLLSCGGFPPASLSSDAVRNSPLLWILLSQTDQRSPEVEALDSFIAPGWLFIHRRFHPGKLPSRFADCLVETFKGTSPHFLKENLMKMVPEEGSEQTSTL